MSRRKAREFAFKVLFQVDQVNADPRCAFQYLLQEYTLAEKDWDFSWDLIVGSLDHLEQIDKEIEAYIRDWSIDRLSAVDRNIIRLAGYEVLFYEHSQPVVAIDEALEIARKYGDDNSVAFINAILDKMLGESK